MSDWEEQLHRIDELDDPLALYERYYLHMQNTHAPISQQTELLDRATKAFINDLRYRNDPRYLSLFLAYTKRVSKPENVFAYLSMQGIASELAAYYEEYGAYLEQRGKEGDIEKTREILRGGVERGAKPIERLKRTFAEFENRHGTENHVAAKGTVPVKEYRGPRSSEMLPTPWTEGPRKAEHHGYNDSLIYVPNDELTFEEVRARSWRRPASKSTGRSLPLGTVPAKRDIEDHYDEDDLLGIPPSLGQPLPNLDDLTQISIYRDNTMDLREISRKIAVQKRAEVEDLIMMASPWDQQEEARDTIRLSTIQEESDAQTQQSAFFLKGRLGLAELEASFAGSLKLVDTNEPILDRFAAARKAPLLQNATIASLKTAVGCYLVERPLGDQSILAGDLASTPAFETEEETEVRQLVLKTCLSLAEPAVLKRVQEIPQLSSHQRLCFPKLQCATCRHLDSLLFSMTYYCHGSLSALGPCDDRLMLFWARELLFAVLALNQAGIIHGSIVSEKVLIRLGTSPLGPSFAADGSGGWADRGIALCGFSLAIDTGLLRPSVRDGLLDIDLLVKYRGVHGNGLSDKLATIDTFGVAKILERLHAPRYAELLKRAQAILLQDFTWSQAGLALSQVLTLFEQQLLLDSPVLPTLKSLLTKLEISLLEQKSNTKV